MNKAGLTIFLLCFTLLGNASEKLFLLAEDEFHSFLKHDFHRFALSLADKYESKLGSVPVKGEIPVLKITKVKDSDKNYESVSFAVKGALFFVNEKNPVRDLSSAELKQIYSGKFKEWSRTKVPVRQICYSGGGITVPSSRETGSAAWVQFPNSPMALQMLTLDFTALGVIPLTDAVLNVKGTRALTVDGVAATPKTVMDGSYHGSVRYYLSIRKDAPLEVRALYDHLRTKQTKIKLLKAGFLPAVEGD